MNKQVLLCGLVGVALVTAGVIVLKLTDQVQER